MFTQDPMNPGSPGVPTSCQSSDSARVFASWAVGTVPSVETSICAPVSVPFLIFAAVTARFLIFAVVTEFFFSCLAPTLFFGSCLTA